MSWSQRISVSDWPATIQSVAGTVIVAIFAVTFVVQAFTIPSESMEKTLLIGDYLLVDKFCYGESGFWNLILPYRKIRRGDIVVFHYPVNPSQHFVKRVVALPGDRLRLINKQVYINGAPLAEPYVQYIASDREPYRDDFPRTDAAVPDVTAGWWREMRTLVEDRQLIIPEGNYFVLGDNRDDSKDSRYWGFVPRESIIGRPLLIYWSASNLNNDLPTSPTVGDRLYHLAYAITHVFQITRWERTFRRVK
ncbi:MAG TPA: signal peptidase I [Terriglobales bacterium]|nr:signal peptidase I [Terriglobales bacterium]